MLVVDATMYRQSNGMPRQIMVVWDGDRVAVGSKIALPFAA